ncbi:hypothetical protein VTG60DRAFT_1088 [Thermothelomyces hinnuleus]
MANLFVCGSDIHIMHVAIPIVEKGDVLGHDFYAVVQSGRALYGLCMRGTFGYSHGHVTGGDADG